MNWSNKVRRLALGAGLLASPLLLAATSATLTLSSAQHTLGQAAPSVSLAAQSSEGGTFDVHLGLIGPDGTVYEFPNWKANDFTPSFAAVSLPAGFSLPATKLFDLASFSGLTAGNWQAVVALAEPGTLKFVGTPQLLPLQVTAASTGGAMLGGLSFSIPVNGATTMANSKVASELVSNSASSTRKMIWGDLAAPPKLIVQNSTVGSGSTAYETLTVNLATATPLLSAQLADSSGGVCMLTDSAATASLTKYYKLCSTLGISFDRSAGTVSFNKTNLKDMVGSNGTFTVSGGMNFTPY